jgi:hypothetical protein
MTTTAINHFHIARIIEPPGACMTGGRVLFYELQPDRVTHDSLLAGGPLDAPNHLPFGGAWNFRYMGVELTYGSVLRQRVLL